jgi:hypothetical protein
MKNQQQQLWMKVHHHLEWWIPLGCWTFIHHFKLSGKKIFNFYISFSKKEFSTHTHPPWLESLVVCQPIGAGKPNVAARDSNFN